MKRFSFRDSLLMLAPVAVLGAFGWLLRARKPAVIIPTGPFQPFIRRVQVLPALPGDVFDGYDTRVVVEFDAHGRLPAWWTAAGNSYYLGVGGQLVGVKNGKMTPLTIAPYSNSPHKDSGKWVSIYKLKLRDVAPQSGQIRLRHTVKFTDNNENTIAKLWLDTPVRVAGVTTKVPSVLRVPRVKIEKFSLDPAPPIDSHDGTERWRARWTLLHQDSSGSNVNVQVVSRHGRRLGSMDGATYSSADNSSTAYVHNSDPRRAFITEDFALDSGTGVLPPPITEPLWLQGAIRSGDKWPLAIKIPLRDATGKMLFTPRTSTVPFRVLSVKKISPTPDEVKEYGSDAVVAVVMQAWNPKADVSAWRWEIDYSQHLHSANAGDIWELPYIRGKSTFGASYTWPQDKTRFELRYQLVLKAVPAKAGKLVFHADIAANQSRRIPVEVVVRP